MKDYTTFLKLQEAALNKQAEAKRQGYEGNTSNTPTNQQGNNGVPQGQDQPKPGTRRRRRICSIERAHHSNHTACAKVEQRGKKS
jgi:hypothetical protein